MSSSLLTRLLLLTTVLSLLLMLPSPSLSARKGNSRRRGKHRKAAHTVATTNLISLSPRMQAYLDNENVSLTLRLTRRRGN